MPPRLRLFYSLLTGALLLEAFRYLVDAGNQPAVAE